MRAAAVQMSCRAAISIVATAILSRKWRRMLPMHDLFVCSCARLSHQNTRHKQLVFCTPLLPLPDASFHASTALISFTLFFFLSSWFVLCVLYRLLRRLATSSLSSPLSPTASRATLLDHDVHLRAFHPPLAFPSASV